MNNQQIPLYQEPKNIHLMKGLDLFMSNDPNSDKDLIKLFEETDNQLQSLKASRQGAFQYQKQNRPSK